MRVQNGWDNEQIMTVELLDREGAHMIDDHGQRGFMCWPEALDMILGLAHE